MSGFTPGKWTVCGVGQEWPGIESKPCSIIIFGNADEECGVRGRSHEEAVANARLIAAAPDYDAAARGLIDRHDAKARAANFARCGCEDCAPFRAVIGKAEGK